MNPRRWNSNDGDLTLVTVRSLYDAVHFRVTESAYPPGAAFPGRTKQCTWYVLQGACILTTNGERQLSAGDVVDLDEGNYEVCVVGDDGLRLVRVWQLPRGVD